MNWSKGFSASFHATFVDSKTWADTDVLEITGGTINHTDSGLLESADVDCTDYEHGIERWIRIWMDAEQAGEWEHIPLFTGLASTPDKKIKGSLITHTLKCYSVLKPASDVLLPQGWFAASGFIGAEVIRKLLTVCNAPVIIEGDSPRLSDHLIAEQGETNLTMIEKILNAIDWRLKISGDGSITICAKSDDAVVTFDNLESDAVEPSVNVEYDLFDCPNVFRAISGAISFEAKDEDDASELSIQNRGREVWKEETSVTLNDGESIQRYAKRRLKELQGVSMTISYDRRYHSDVHVGDVIRLNYPVQNLVGTFKVTSQKISLGAGLKVSEEVIKYADR